MNAMCGIIFQDPSRTANKDELRRLAEALSQRPDSCVQTRSMGSAAFSVRSVSPSHGGIAAKVLNGHPVVVACVAEPVSQAELWYDVPDAQDCAARVLDLYIKHGCEFIHSLRGDFSIAVWDGRGESILLVTDRFRVLPLVYSHDQGTLYFSSSVADLVRLRDGKAVRTINPAAIVDVMGFSCVTSPRTIYREILKLPAGTSLTCDRGGIRVASYWQVNFARPSAAPEAELAGDVRSSLLDAVSVRLDRDMKTAKIGTFLSGGIDSSTVTGLVGKLSKQSPMSFSIGFEEEPFNEMSYARIAAAHFGAQHYEYRVSAQDAYDLVPTLLSAFDEPFANASAIPTYYCARLARQHGINVLYAGDGGDELFAGNERYSSQRVFDYYYMIPGWLRESILRPAVFALANTISGGIFLKGKKYIKRASTPNPQRLTSYGLFSETPMGSLFEQSFIDSLPDGHNPYGPFYAYYQEAPAGTELDRQLYVDLKITISDNDLVKVTKMCDAAGIGVRFPFLDHHVAELAAKIPAGLKMRGRELRTFFKKAYADFLPPAVLSKTKHGFGLPIAGWLRAHKPFNEMMLELVLSPRSSQRGYFKKASLEEIIKRHKTDPSSFYGTVLWNVMMIELWHRQCHDGRS